MRFILTKSLFIVNILSILLNISLLGSYEDIGELFIAPICSTHGETHIESVLNLLKERRIGGVIFMEGTMEMQKKILQRIENEVDRSIFVFQDGEWGLGMRLRDLPKLPRNLTLGAITDLALLKEYGREVARQCQEMGVDSPLAPCVDINSNPLNPVIGSRSFGDDPYRVTELALAVLEGMREGGILGCAKHFPGHGNTLADSHSVLPVIEKSLNELETFEFLPFKALIKNGVEMVMVGHLQLSALSLLPSSLSFEIVTNLLRQEMGFQGLIVTDALNMKALTSERPLTEVFEMAFLAGADLLLTATARPEVSHYLIEQGIPEAIDHLLRVVPEELLRARVERVRSFTKAQRRDPAPAYPDLRRSLYRHALTSIGETKFRQVSVLTLVQSKPDPDLEEALSRYVALEVVGFEDLKDVKGPCLINLRRGDAVEQIPEEAIVALFSVPYFLPNHPHVLVAYEDVPEMKEAVADALFTPFTPSGKLPIQVSEKYEWEIQRSLERVAL